MKYKNSREAEWRVVFSILAVIYFVCIVLHFLGVINMRRF